MNGRTAKLIRKFCLASGQNIRKTKAIWKSIPSNMRFRRRRGMIGYVQDAA